MEWLALLWPALGGILAAVFWRKKMKWWEFFIPFGVALIAIAVFKFGAETSQVRDTEYWTGYGTEVRYYEEWDEYIHKTCTRTWTDSDGNTHSEPYDCSYVQDHPAYWQIIDNNGIEVGISRSEYRRIKNNWGRRAQFVDMHRNYHWTDGDLYIVEWPGSTSTMEVVTTTHGYENKVQASRNVVNRFIKPSKEQVKQFGLYEYPKVQGYTCPSILGSGPGVKEAERELSILNAEYGRKKQIRIFVLLYQGQSEEAGRMQENYWVGGNKNELNIAIGLDDTGKVQWGYPFSWTDEKQVLVGVDSWLYKQQGETLDLSQLFFELEPIVEGKWKRKAFADFNYLKVDIPFWAIIAIHLVTMLLSYLALWWCVVNEHHDEPRSYGYRRRNW